MKVSETRVDTVEIAGFKTEAVKIFFTYLAGHDSVVESCKQFSILADMIYICEKYEFTNHVNVIIKSIFSCPITMDNLIEVVDISEGLSKLEKYKKLSEYL